MTASLFGLPAPTLRPINVKNFGAVGDGVTDDTAAIVAALTASQVVYFPASTGQYMTTGFVLPSAHTIFGHGQVAIKMMPDVGNHVITLANGGIGQEVIDIEIDGNKANVPAGGIGIACSSIGGGVTRTVLRGVYVHDTGADGTRFFGATCQYINVTQCRFENCTTAGLTSDDTIQYFTWHGNIALNNGTHGIGWIGTALDGVISSCNSSNNGQAVPSADNFTGYNSNCARISIIGNISTGGKNNCMHFGGNFYTYSGNEVSGATEYGMLHQSELPGGTVVTSNGVSMVANTISGCSGPAGLAVSSCNSATLTGNSVQNNANAGIDLINCSHSMVCSNSIRSNGSGLHVVTGGVDLNISTNIICDNTADGIDLDALSVSIVNANLIRNNGGTGLNLIGADTACSYTNNVIVNNTTVDIAGTFDINSTFFGNTHNNPTTLATAATLTIPAWSDIWNLTGSAAISNINSIRTGRKIVLIAGSAVVITEAGNLQMAGNCNLTATGTISYVGNGTHVTELARSLN